MRRSFNMTWLKFAKTLEAELLEEQDSKLCQYFWNTLPFKSIQSHAVCAGMQMYCPVRLVCIPSHPFYEPMNEQPTGTVNIDLDFQYLAVNYGLVTEPLPALPIARVKENVIEELRTVGRMVWDNLLFSDEFVVVSFDKREGPGD